MGDFWTVTDTPVGYGSFSRGLEYVIGENYSDSVDILDVGACGGEGLAEILDGMEESSGVSINAYALEPQSVVYENIENDEVDFPVRGMAGHSDFAMPFQDDSFDIVVSNYLLPFLDEQEDSLDDILSVVRDDGYVALHLSPGEASERWITSTEKFADAVANFPTELDRSDNLVHSDSRGDLP